MDNKYILIDAEPIIGRLNAIIDYCSSHMYKNTVSATLVKKLPYMDKPSITFHLYKRDTDNELHRMMKEACEACDGAAMHVLKAGDPDNPGSYETTGGVTLQCRLLQHGEDESLMETIPESWVRPLLPGVGARY